MKTKLLLITPPFTQLNTPYPATAYIKGFLNTINIESVQADLGIEVILKLFSKNGLQDLFDNAIKVIKETLTNIEVSKKLDLIKISLVGIGMMSHSGVAATVFQIFAKEDIKFYQVTTSEISISYTIDKSNKEKAVNALGKEFNL